MQKKRKGIMGGTRNEGATWQLGSLPKEKKGPKFNKANVNKTKR